MKQYDIRKMQTLTSILEGDLSLIEDFDMNQGACLREKIIVKPSYIRNMLLRYLSHEISDYELNQWARFICLRGEYIVPGVYDDDIADFYEDMYYVIQRVSTPEIDGDIDEGRIQAYLDELNKKYPNDPPEEHCITDW